MRTESQMDDRLLELRGLKNLSELARQLILEEYQRKTNPATVEVPAK